MSEKTDKSSHRKKADKPVEGRKYAVISSQLIVSLAESREIPGLNEELASKIGEDVTYRLREIIQGCSIHMRSCNERVLRSIDVARVLPNCSEMQGFGYLSGGSSDFLYVPEAKVFVGESDELVINLSQLALGHEVYIQKGEQNLKGVWCLPDNPVECSDGATDTSASTSTESPTNEPVLPRHLIEYYSTFAKIILCKRGNVLQKVLQNLRTSSKITLTVPYFLNLLIVWLQELPRGSDACENLLLMLHSLTMNPYIYRDATVVVNGLITSLLVYAVDPLSSEVASVSKDFEQRELAAEAVAKVMVHWYGCDDAMYLNILQKVQILLFDSGSSVCSHFGALSVLCYLGDSALSKCLWPHLGKYLEFLSRLPVNLESSELGGCVLKAAGILCKQMPNFVEVLEDGTINTQQIAICDRLLYLYFGDSLCAQWRYPIATSLNETYQNSGTKGVKAEVEELVSTEKERVSKFGCVSSVYSNQGTTTVETLWHCNSSDISVSSVSKNCDGSAENACEGLQSTNGVTGKKRMRKEMKDSGGSFHQMFELQPMRKQIMTISSVQGVPVWSRKLRRRELDSSHQPFCKSTYHKKCLQLNYVSRLAKHSDMSSWNVDINDIFSTCL